MTGRQKVMGAGLLTGQGNGYRVDKIRNLYRMMLCDTYFFILKTMIVDIQIYCKECSHMSLSVFLRSLDFGLCSNKAE